MKKQTDLSWWVAVAAGATMVFVPPFAFEPATSAAGLAILTGALLLKDD
jgi:hypothetical protein